MSNGHKRQQAKGDDLAYTAFIWSVYVGVACGVGVFGFVVWDLIQKNRSAVASSGTPTKERKARRPAWLRAVPDPSSDQDSSVDETGSSSNSG